VNLKYEDDRPVDSKGVGRKVIDKLQQTYHSELFNKDFAYDGEKSLFTVGALPQVNNEFTVVLEDVSTGKLVLFLNCFLCFCESLSIFLCCLTLSWL
jgi:eukaryotic translation initiation factor 2C